MQQSATTILHITQTEVRQTSVASPIAGPESKAKLTGSTLASALSGLEWNWIYQTPRF